MWCIFFRAVYVCVCLWDFKGGMMTFAALCLRVHTSGNEHQVAPLHTHTHTHTHTRTHTPTFPCVLQYNSRDGEQEIEVGKEIEEKGLECGW